jgi:hypothetical protein
VFGDRLEQFSRERLDGRPLPDDLRALLEAQWAGRQEFYEISELVFLEPGAASPLLDHGYLNEQDRADPDIMANVAAHKQMAKYFKAVAVAGDGLGDCYGYWMHPDEVRTGRPDHSLGHRRLIPRPAQGLFRRGVHRRKGGPQRGRRAIRGDGRTGR